MKAHAVESNANAAAQNADRQLARLNRQQAKQDQLDNWMNDVQEDAEQDLLRYETTYSGGTNRHLFE